MNTKTQAHTKTTLSPSSFTPASTGLLQRKCACGNHTTAGRECAECGKTKRIGLQTKLKINEPGDVYEREADQIADQVMATPAHSTVRGTPPRMQRFSGQSNGQMDAAPASVDRALASPGRPLEPAIRQDMEQRFGQDFSRVRVHTGAAAEQSARDVNAHAYTVGHDIVLGAGQFAPGTHKERRLIAHELTHVLQQAGADGTRASQNEQRGLSGLSPIPLAIGADAPLPSPLKVQRQKEPSPKASDTDEAAPAPAGSATGSQSQWTTGDLGITFWISNQKIRDASFLTIGGPATGPGFTVWSNRRVFSIIPPERAWLHTNYWVDTAEHPLPPNQRPFSVTNDIKFTTSSGQTTVDAHYSDDNPKYDGPGRALSPKLGHTSPAARDLPVYELPLNEGGELMWRAGFSFAKGGGMRFEVRGKFQVQAPGSGTATQPDIKPSPGGPTKASGEPPEKTPESKGASQPPSPAPQQEPPAAIREIKELTELIKKTSDAATKDPLVRKLRDLLSKLQPFMSAKDAQKEIDDAIRSLVKDGVDAAIMAILKAVTGKSPSAMPENRNQTGPDVPQKDLGEHIIQGPKIPIKDVPAPAPKLSFQYRNGPQKSYEAGAVIRFTLIPPDNFNSLQGAKRLVIVAEADRNTPNPERFGRVDLESASPKAIELQAPQKPGKYVIRVDIGLGFDYSNMQEFEVTAPQKK